jgi:hypothetical protein
VRDVNFNSPTVLVVEGITGIYVTDVVSRILYVGGDDESAFVTLLHLANMAANSKVYTIRRFISSIVMCIPHDRRCFFPCLSFFFS